MDYETYFSEINNDPTTDTLDRLAKLTISDFMVPLDVMIEQMMQVEKCDTIDLSYRYVVRNQDGSYSKEGHLRDTGLFTVQYPSNQPCCPEYVDMNRSDLTDENVDDWVSTINRFVQPLVRNALRIEDIARIESRENCGLILHTYTGEIEEFDYNELVTLDAIMCPDVLPDLMAGYRSGSHLIRSFVVPGYIRMFYTPTDNPADKYVRVFYQYRFRSKSGDRFNEDGTYTALAPYGVSPEHAITWSSYIFSMLDRYSKVILFP